MRLKRIDIVGKEMAMFEIAGGIVLAYAMMAAIAAAALAYG